MLGLVFISKTQAQVPEFSVYFSLNSKTAVPGDEVEFSGTITQLTSGTKDYTMAYSIISMPSDWSFYYCDPLYCHSSATTSSTFTISEVGSNVIKGYFVVPSAGSGSVELSFTQMNSNIDTTIILSVNPNSVSIQENQTDFAAEVYPNPSNQNWNISTKTPVTQWELIDTSGRTVLKQHSRKTQSFSIDSTGLNSGVYILKLFNNSAPLKEISLIKL